jgi:TolB-like protein
MILLLSTVLAAAAPVSIAAPGINCARIEKVVCDSFLDRFVTVLGTSGELRVVTGNDISQLIGLERQKQLMGCADSSTSCVAELAGALGVDGVISVSVVKSDPSYIVTTRVVRSADAAIWASATERVEREGDVYDALDAVAERFRRTLTAPAGGVPTASKSSGPRLLPFAPAALGAVLALVGAGVFVSAGSERQQLMSSPEIQTIRGIVSSGQTKELAGVALWVTAGVAVAASVLWLLLGGGS